MNELLKTIILNLVDNKEVVTINEKQEKNAITFEVKVAKEDMGKVIGKKIIRILIQKG